MPKTDFPVSLQERISLHLLQRGGELSTSEAETLIFNQRIEIDRARRTYRDDAMKNYDEVIYRPAIDDIRKLCGEKLGHRFHAVGPDAAGVQQHLCSVCGEMKHAS